MPTFDTTATFSRDHSRLTREARAAFGVAVPKFVEDIENGNGFRAGLRVKGIRSRDGVFEMTFDDDGRATFEYGEEVRPGETHIVWRRIGSHAVLDDA